jgi:hypothetical protein
MLEGSDSATRGLLVAANGIMEPSLKKFRKEDLYTARTLVRAQRKVPLQNMYVRNRDQVPAGEIEESDSPYSSPFVLVQKMKKRDLRDFCDAE